MPVNVPAGHGGSAQVIVALLAVYLIGTDVVVGPKAYGFKGTNGFMLTFDMTSKDIPAPKGSSMNY